jgi:hypothetical protein
MSADDYYARLKCNRIFISGFVLAIWVIYTLEAGFDDPWWDVTIFLALFWAVAYPRNWAKIAARWNRRKSDFDEAFENERQRREED